MNPGEYLLADGDIIANEGKRTVDIHVRNTGDRPIQVGSHFHFFEVNRYLSFDRERALGMRLNIASGLAIRFEPGQSHEVQLVEFGGTKTVHGLNNLTEGKFEDAKVRAEGLKRARAFIEQAKKK